MGCCQSKQDARYKQVSEREPRDDESDSDDELAEHADDDVRLRFNFLFPSFSPSSPPREAVLDTIPW